MTYRPSCFETAFTYRESNKATLIERKIILLLLFNI
jgi:hypothetical protein